MALDSFTGLKAAIASWMNRSDLTAQIPDFITLAESRISSDIGDIPLVRLDGTITTVAGQRKYTAPTGFVRIDFASRNQPSSTPMQIVSDRTLAEKYDFEQYTSIPEMIAFDGVDFVLHPTPDGVYDIDYTAQNVLQALSDSNPTNIILTRFPGLYLWGAVAEASTYCRDSAMSAAAEGKYRSALKDARSADYVGNAKLRVDPAMTSRGRFNFTTGD